MAYEYHLTGDVATMKWKLAFIEKNEALIEQIMEMYPKVRMQDVYDWYQSAEAHDQPLTAAEFVEWLKRDDDGNLKEKE